MGGRWGACDVRDGDRPRHGDGRLPRWGRSAGGQRDGRGRGPAPPALAGGATGHHRRVPDLPQRDPVHVRPRPLRGRPGGAGHPRGRGAGIDGGGPGHRAPPDGRGARPGHRLRPRHRRDLHGPGRGRRRRAGCRGRAGPRRITDHDGHLRARRAGGLCPGHAGRAAGRQLPGRRWRGSRSAVGPVCRDEHGRAPRAGSGCPVRLAVPLREPVAGAGAGVRAGRGREPGPARPCRDHAGTRGLGIHPSGLRRAAVGAPWAGAPHPRRGAARPGAPPDAGVGVVGDPPPRLDGTGDMDVRGCGTDRHDGLDAARRARHVGGLRLHLRDDRVRWGPPRSSRRTGRSPAR